VPSHTGFSLPESRYVITLGVLIGVPYTLAYLPFCTVNTTILTAKQFFSEPVLTLDLRCSIAHCPGGEAVRIHRHPSHRSEWVRQVQPSDMWISEST
jgi:hypothetical protein